jgi:ribosomal protein L11 methyltransferase
VSDVFRSKRSHGARKALLIPDQLVERHIHTLLGQEYIRLSPSDLIQALRVRLPLSTRAQVRSVIKTMVMSGQLAYTHHFGSTQLERYRLGPMRISDRIALYPGQGGVTFRAGVSIIRIEAGASFGCGDHPTTRLALRGLDTVLLDACRYQPMETITVLDLGTGSGILAIAAAMLGVKHAIGIDVDQVACHEATINATINGVQQKVSIICGTLEEQSAGPFDIILANLRPPTLVQIAERMHDQTRSHGFWILSGFRPDERPAVEKSLPKSAHMVWAEDDRGWAAAGYHF